MVIRADATGDEKIGVGHVMRCIALAEEWIERGGRVTLMSVECIPWVVGAVERAGIEFVKMPKVGIGTDYDARHLVEFADGCGASWVVVDGYSFTEYYMLRLVGYGFETMILDDYGHCSEYFSDIVLNQDVNYDDFYAGIHAPFTCILLGDEYALIRREFREARARRKSHGIWPNTVFLGMGGNDPLGVSKIVSEIVSGIGMQPVISDRNNGSVSEVMARCQIGVVNGGTTAMEAIAVGLPIVIVPLSDNQKEPACYYDAIGAAAMLYESCICDLPDRIEHVIRHSEDMTNIGTSLIDGQGPSRVVNEMLEVKDA